MKLTSKNTQQPDDTYDKGRSKSQKMTYKIKPDNLPRKSPQRISQIEAHVEMCNNFMQINQSGANCEWSKQIE